MRARTNVKFPGSLFSNMSRDNMGRDITGGWEQGHVDFSPWVGAAYLAEITFPHQWVHMLRASPCNFRFGICLKNILRTLSTLHEGRLNHSVKISCTFGKNPFVFQGRFTKDLPSYCFGRSCMPFRRVTYPSILQNYLLQKQFLPSNKW